MIKKSLGKGRIYIERSWVGDRTVYLGSLLVFKGIVTKKRDKKVRGV
jgi:hypothetical protein